MFSPSNNINNYPDLGLEQSSSMDPGSCYPMNAYTQAPSYQFRGYNRKDLQIAVVQQPRIGKCTVGEDKNRKPIDPPPVVRLKVRSESDPEQSYLQSPYFFVTCNLVQPPESRAPQPPSNALVGVAVSSLHRLKDLDNKEGAFFIFGDLSVRLEGQFALQFNLYELGDRFAVHVRSIISDKFTVQGPKVFPGLNESTPLTRSFSEQGVRLRVRKEPRLLLRKRGPADPEGYVPRRKPGKEEESQELFGSPESSRHSQAGQQALMQPHLEEREQQIGHEAYDPNLDEPLVKRPRTDSEHSQFGNTSQRIAFAPQSQHMASFGEQRQPLLTHTLYPQHLPQGMYGGSPHAYSPVNYRVPSFSQFDPQQGMETHTYDQSPHTYFSPQAQPRYQHPYGYGGESAPSFQPYGVIDDGSREAGMGEAEMGHPQFHRISSNAGFGSMMGHQGEGRSGYVPVQHAYPQLGHNVSAGGMSSPSVPITTGPGPMDNTYQ